MTAVKHNRILREKQTSSTMIWLFLTNPQENVLY